MNKTLSKQATEILDAYKTLHIGNIEIPCLYYNNKRQNIRAGLRVSIGKGNPKDILDEVNILALKHKVDLSTMNETAIRTFLQKEHIGIDCSALVYYALDAELKGRKIKSLKRSLSFPFATTIIRKFLCKLRPVENTNVRTLAHESNSKEICISDVRPGDIITILEGGLDHKFYHTMIVSSVTYSDDAVPTTVTYTHSYQWSTDGKYNHGVRNGKIRITDANKPLLDQVWTEQEKSGVENETFVRASEACAVSLRRLHILG
jgi:hypothetical protein